MLEPSCPHAVSISSPRRLSMPVRPAIAMAAVLPALLLATGCAVVREEEDGKTTRVAISTPVGGLAARTGENTGDTGLPVYPGAQLSRDEGRWRFRPGERRHRHALVRPARHRGRVRERRIARADPRLLPRPVDDIRRRHRVPRRRELQERAARVPFAAPLGGRPAPGGHRAASPHRVGEAARRRHRVRPRLHPDGFLTTLSGGAA